MKDVKMKGKSFVKEHEKLASMLKTSDKPELREEGKEQEDELRRVRARLHLKGKK